MDVTSTANRLLVEHGLAERGWKFELDNARRRAGRCSFRHKVVSLSKYYVALNLTDKPDDILDTILHEIAHAIAGHAAGHGPEWKEVCTRIGARPERCYDSSKVKMPDGNMVATCGGCAKTFRKHRVKRGRVRWCAACGPDKGLLEFKHITESKPTPTPVVILPKVAPPQTTKLRGM